MKGDTSCFLYRTVFRCFLGLQWTMSFNAGFDKKKNNQKATTLHRMLSFSNLSLDLATESRLRRIKSGNY